MTPTAPPSRWLTAADCKLDEFRKVVERETRLRDYPHADTVSQGALLYGEKLAADIASPAGRRDVQGELADALLNGPGVVVFKHAFKPDVLNRAAACYDDLIRQQKAQGVQTGDHFAKPGSNDRLWGALEKLAVADPEAFIDYFANDVIALVSAAWLGPNYQVISEPNVVNPGSEAQRPHRDYHLGNMGTEMAEAFPAHVHRYSPMLTLQAAIAHCDMPTEAGPTMYLPHSQKYEHGFLAANLQEFQDYFDAHYVQVPLEKGDAVFFNPALLHGAGANRTTDVHRMANLLQISSAFSRPSATVDTESVVTAIYASLRARRKTGASERYLRNVVTASSEGYPFPTNLDRDRPVASLAPESQAQLLWRALEQDWDDESLRAELAAQAERRRSTFTRADLPA
jgi:ectoine hydroxylase-related dioxygenase (phytanoyl-CoA dioxygenase family)